MEQQINNENKTKQANREYKSRLFSYIFGREETKDRTLSRIKSFTDRQTAVVCIHSRCAFGLRFWVNLAWVLLPKSKISTALQDRQIYTGLILPFFVCF